MIPEAQHIPNRRRSLWRWIFSAVILLLMVISTWSNIGQVRQVQFSYRWEHVVLAGACLLISLTIQLVGWVLIIRRLAPDPGSWRQLARVHVVAWASRYVPLGVTPFVTKFVLGQRLGISSSALTLSMVLENILGIAAVFLIALLSYPVIIHTTINGYVVALCFVSIIGILVWPQGLVSVSNWLLLRLKRQPMSTVAVGWRDTTGWLFLYLAAAGIGGIGFFFLVLGLIQWPVSSITAAGLFNAASFIGLVTIVAPAGLGAREAALAALLLPWFPWPVGVVLAAVTRLWSVITDGIWLAMAWVISRDRK